MNLAAAEILDAARAGAPITDDAITQALIDSGDLDADDWPMVRRHCDAGEWESKTPGVGLMAGPFDMVFDRSEI